MAEENSEQLRPLIKEGKIPGKTMADTVGLTEEKVLKIGEKVEKLAPKEKADKDDSEAEKSRSKGSLGAIWDAFLGAFMKLEGIKVSNGGLEAGPNPNPLRNWSNEALRKEFLVWSTLKADSRVPEIADFKSRMVESILKVAVERKIFAYVSFGEYWDATSALEMTPLSAGAVKKANPKVGEAFSRFITTWEETEWNPDKLLETYTEWRELQKQYNLKKEFDPKNARSLTPADQAALAILELVQNTLTMHKADSSSHRRSSHVAPGVDSQRSERKAPARSLEDERRDLMRLADEREAALARGALVAKQAGKEGSTLRPQMSEGERGAFIQEMQKKGFEQPAIDSMLRDMESSKVQRVSASARSESIGSGAARTEAVGRSAREENYFDVKDRLMHQDDWSEFGWSAEEKANIAGLLGQFSPDEQINIMAAVLLQGKTAAETIPVLERAMNDPRQGITGFLSDLEILTNDDQIMKILIPSDLDRRKYLDQNYFQLEPRSIEELAWQIEFENPAIFGKNGPYPVLERTVEKVNGKYTFRERVSPANIVQWMRYVQFQAHSNHTMKPIDFAQETGIRKTWKVLNVYEMLDHKAAMGRSKYGGDFTGLISYLEVETGLYGGPRSNYLQVWHNKGSAESMVKIRNEQFYENFFTRPFGGKSMFSWMHQMAETFDVSSLTDNVPSDGKMGATINTIFWTYASIANPKEMTRILGLGEDVRNLAKVFNLKNLRETRNELAKTEEKDTWLNLSDSGEINGVRIKDVFDLSTGNAKLANHKDVYNFMKMFNFYAYTSPSENGKTLFREVVARRAAEMHGLATTINGVKVPWNKDLAENVAFYNTWFFGVSATNDVLGAAHQWETKTSGDYRRKTIGGKLVGGKPEGGRAGEYGNVYTVDVFKRWLISPFHGIRTTTADKERPGNFKAISQVMGEAQHDRYTTDEAIGTEIRRRFQSGELDEKIQEKIQKIQALQEKKRVSGELKDEDVKKLPEIRKAAEKEAQVDEWNRLLRTERGKESLRQYKAKAEEFTFKEDSMYKYIKDHYEKGAHLDERLRGAKELSFDKYIKYVPLVGATFDQEAWQKDMAGLVTDVRYAFQNYGELNYNMMVQDWDPKIEEVREMTLGESMFGDQLVNIPELRGKDGKVDWDIVNSGDGQKVLFKRWLETFIIGQLLQYRELQTWSTSPRYSFAMTEDILDAIRKIPGIVEYDSDNMRRTRVTEFFFNKAAMKRIRKESGTGKFKMYFLETLNSALFGSAGKKEGFFSGLFDALGIIAEKSFSGVATA